MIFRDYAPPASPTVDEQREALQKGLGRAWIWAHAGRIDEQLLLQTCLSDQRFDQQCESYRGDWLWELILAANSIDRFRQPILQAINDPTADVEIYQLCQLACHYAAAGSEDFKTALYGVAERYSPLDDCTAGERQILTLDGEQALLFIASVRGRALETSPWNWDDAAFVDRASEIVDKTRIDVLFESTSDPAIRRFAQEWRIRSAPETAPDGTSCNDTIEMVTASDVIDAALHNTKRFHYRLWGINATTEDLETVLHKLWTCHSPHVITRLLKVFSVRPLPIFDARLIDFCTHEDEDVRRRAFNALEQNSHPLVRQLAFDELRKPITWRSPIGLLVRNYEPGDEQWLMHNVELVSNPDLKHSMLMDILELLEENENAEASQLGLIAYAETPCELCRSRALELLNCKGLVPEWMFTECLHDSSEDCRQLVSPESPTTPSVQ